MQAERLEMGRQHQHKQIRVQQGLPIDSFENKEHYHAKEGYSRPNDVKQSAGTFKQ